MMESNICTKFLLQNKASCAVWFVWRSEQVMPRIVLQYKP